MPASPPLAALLLAAAVTVLLAASASPAAADKHIIGGGGGRMVIVRAPGTSRWQRRLVEDEVAPEFGSGLLLGADQGHISYDTLNKDAAACGDNCAGKGKPYTRPCTYQGQCRG